MSDNLPWLTESPAGHLNTVRDVSLSKLVRDDMLALILKGVLEPGQRINEPDVASRLQVSRVPVREALRELESSGLVISRKHAGVFVRRLDADEVRDLYQMRGLLDGFAGARAARLPAAKREALVKLLDVSNQVMQAAASLHDVQHYYSENLRFHWAIVEAAGNRQLSDTYRGIVQKLHLSRLKNLAKDIGMKISIAEHVEIAKALRDADPARCEALLSRHVGDAYQRLQLSGDPASSTTTTTTPASITP